MRLSGVRSTAKSPVKPLIRSRALGWVTSMEIGGVASVHNTTKAYKHERPDEKIYTNS